MRDMWLLRRPEGGPSLAPWPSGSLWMRLGLYTLVVGVISLGFLMVRRPEDLCLASDAHVSPCQVRSTRLCRSASAPPPTL
jgi:hypothetical protein